MACRDCEFYDSDFEELNNEEYEHCNKGHQGLKGFPFKDNPKCFEQNKRKLEENQPNFWDDLGKTN